MTGPTDRPSDDRGDKFGEFNNALQVAHSILRLLEGKIAQTDVIGAQALAVMLHEQLIGLGSHGAALVSRTAR